MTDQPDHFTGCLLGLALGDALGAPFEGLPADTIYRDYGGGLNAATQPPLDTLHYTDDTEMTLGVAQTLVAHGRIDPDDLMDRFSANFNPARGYGPGTREILVTRATGGDWRRLVETQFPGGSLGNGAAMRVAPVGLLFHADLDRLTAEAEASARVTHVHPIGVDSAVLMATAVALAVRMAGGFDYADFIQQLLSRAKTEEFQWQLRTASRLSPDDSWNFGSSLPAHRSVTSAILCFAFAPTSFHHAVGRAISMGDDTDTLAAIAGALVGAHVGIAGLPSDQIGRVEDGERGRTFLAELGTGLASRVPTS
jgi:poly(ADP-ribose) glycohydrolase ARH3